MSGELKVLFVDDDPNALAAYRRTLRGAAVETALGGPEGLAALATKGPYAVVVADMRMPGMDGATFLARVRKASPDTVRMMLTGADDQSTAKQAVNQGQIFRFLSKPCPGETLIQAVAEGIHHHRQLTAERSLLEQTLNGSVRVLTEVLSLIEPEVFGRAEWMRGPIRTLCQELRVEDAWSVELAAMLADIGRLTLPPSVALKLDGGKAMGADEQDMVLRIPEVGGQLLANVPRLEVVGRIVLYQHKDFAGGGFPPDSVKGEEIPIGARILRFVADLAAAERAGTPHAAAIAAMAGKPGVYDPDIIQAAVRCLVDKADRKAHNLLLRKVPYAGLRIGQVLRSPIYSMAGNLLMGSGATISPALLERIANYHRLGGIREPISVEEPDPDDQPAHREA